MSAAIFDSSIFAVNSIDHAKRIILTDEDSTTEDRWARETPYLGELIMDKLDLGPHHRVLDFGSGIGRMAKEIIGRSGCKVWGVDSSITMRCYAPAYVLSDRYLSCTAAMLDGSAGFHYALAIWALQHIPDLDRAVEIIRQHVRSYGLVFVVNMVKRAVPISNGQWYDDKRDVRELMAAKFNEVSYGEIDAERTTQQTARVGYWAVYQKRC